MHRNVHFVNTKYLMTFLAKVQGNNKWAVLDHVRTCSCFSSEPYRKKNKMLKLKLRTLRERIQEIYKTQARRKWEYSMIGTFGKLTIQDVREDPLEAAVNQKIIQHLLVCLEIKLSFSCFPCRVGSWPTERENYTN